MDHAVIPLEGFAASGGDNCVGVELEDFFDRIDGEGEREAIAFGEEGASDGECKGYGDSEGSADSGLSIDFNFAAHVFQVIAHDIHADAATRERGNCVSGTKSGFKDEGEEFFVASGGEEDFIEAHLLSALTDFIERDTSAIIREGDEGAVSAMEGVNFDSTLFWFRVSAADFWGFNAVVKGIAEEMHERVIECFEDIAVYEGISAVDFELNGFIVLKREFAECAREAVEDIREWAHAHLSELALELFSGFMDFASGLVSIIEAEFDIACDFLDLDDSFHDLLGEGMEVTEAVHFEGIKERRVG